MQKPVCVVVGVGPGNGAAFARRFAKAGYATALLARTTELGEALARELGDARAYACDVTDAGAVKTTYAAIRADLGEPRVVLYNAGPGKFGPMAQVEDKDLEEAWRVNTLGLWHNARQVMGPMVARGEGAIIVTGATASLRGAATTTAFAQAKAAQRSLAQSLAKELGPLGVHVALVIVDAVIDLERTRRWMPDKPDTFFAKADDIAETVYHLATQPRSAWSFEVDLRPFGEKW